MPRPRHRRHPLLWVARLLAAEPVRVRLYGVITALVTLLVGRSVLTGYEAPLWIALAAAVLGVAGVETARADVTPTHRVPPPGDEPEVVDSADDH